MAANALLMYLTLLSIFLSSDILKKKKDLLSNGKLISSNSCALSRNEGLSHGDKLRYASSGNLIPLAITHEN